MNTQIRDIHESAIIAANDFRKCEIHLIDILQRVDEKRVFLHFSASSLYDYCTRNLKLSESTALNLITVARKAKEVPALKAAIKSGAITVSKARKITPVLTKENQGEWLQLAETKTSREIEKAVAKEKPELAVEERIQYKTEARLQLQLGISEELEGKLRRVQDLLSQKRARAVSLEEALDAMTNLYLEKNDPIEKAKRAENRKQDGRGLAAEGESFRAEAGDTVQHVPGHVGGSAKKGDPRRYPAELRHAVVSRDQSQCTHVSDDGRRCGNRRWLELHHRRPLSEGGSNDLSNLTTLCYGHHRSLH